eukprot:895335-Ditylum_brightwellii.AAC.1
MMSLVVLLILKKEMNELTGEWELNMSIFNKQNLLLTVFRKTDKVEQWKKKQNQLSIQWKRKEMY